MIIESIELQNYRNIEKLSIWKASYVFIFYAYNAAKKRLKKEK